MDTITLEQLKELFAGLRTETPWNVDGEMLWGYFFNSQTEEKLAHAAEALAQGGYNVVGIFKNEDEPGYLLQVQRVEIHTPESLFARNQQLEALATEFELDAYDGMDVNPVQSEEELAAVDGVDADGQSEFDNSPEGVENPDLVAAIAALAQDPSEGAQDALTMQLQRGLYLVPVFSDPQDPAESEEGEEVQLLVCTDPEGAEFMPLFTDTAAMEAWTEEPVNAMALNAGEAWDFILSQPDCAGAVVNPGGLALPLNRQLVEFLKSGADQADEGGGFSEPVK